MTTIRTDTLFHSANNGKEQKIQSLLFAHRKAAKFHAKEQWKLLFTVGRTNKYHKVSYDKINFSYGQMAEWQVVGQINSWLSNRSNEFKSYVQNSSLSEETKHQLHFINKWRGWYTKDSLIMKDGTEIGSEVKKLARLIFRHLMYKNRKPNLSRISMMVDQRCITLSKGRDSSHFKLWAKLSTMEKGKPIYIPLISYDYFENRGGELLKSVQINEKDGKITFGLMTDMENVFTASRANYMPRTEVIGIDIGLKNLFATDKGDLFGRNYLDQLRKMDCKITKLAAYRQKNKLKTSSTRYKKYVKTLKALIKNAICMFFNRLVKIHAPAVIIMERLNFRSPHLSKRLNRILSNFGKSEIKKKLADLKERFGIEFEEVNPAYTSQMHSCGYVERANRVNQSEFKCRWCGAKAHADVNAAQNIVRRSSTGVVGSVWSRRDAILAELVRQFNERYTRPRARPTDPRFSNFYFKEWKNGLTLSEGSG